MRHAATRAMLERDDVIVVASVSSIYGIGSVETYTAMTFDLKEGEQIDPQQVAKDLVALQFTRNDLAFGRGSFRMSGDVIDIWPAHYEDRAWKLSFFGDELEEIHEFDPLTGKKTTRLEMVKIYANSHYVTPRPTMNQAIMQIKKELKDRLKWLEGHNKLVEAQRLSQRTQFDLELLEATGVCAGIENYSRYLTGRNPGEPPPTLFEYIPEHALLFVDESHASVPQLRAMYNGDFNRKRTLAEFGFRLPSCLDNRPLKFEEWNAMRPQSIYVSATPGPWELEQTQGVFVEQVIRPTGLVDPLIEIRPVSTDNFSQVDDVIDKVKQIAKQGLRSLATTLTKRMAEDLTEYMHEQGVRVRYMHSDIDTIERIEIIRDLRLGKFDVLVGINLLREGLDIPECGLVAIMDADKEGFLRSETSLIQTIGRAARNAQGRVILYADKKTGSIERALAETERRRKRQLAYNQEHGITPKTVHTEVRKLIEDERKTEKSEASLADLISKAQDHAKQGRRAGKRKQAAKKKHNQHSRGFETTQEDILQVAEAQSVFLDEPLPAKEMDAQLKKIIHELREKMLEAAQELEFEKAAQLRDQIQQLERHQLGLMQ